MRLLYALLSICLFSSMSCSAPDSPDDADTASPGEVSETAGGTHAAAAQGSPSENPTPSQANPSEAHSPTATPQNTRSPEEPSPTSNSPTALLGDCRNGDTESRPCGLYANSQELRSCIDNQWQAWETCTCTPSCEGAICGDDGCGSVCGLECKGDFSCAPDGSHCGPPCPDATPLCDDEGCVYNIELTSHLLQGNIAWGGNTMSNSGLSNAFSIGLTRKDATQFYGYSFSSSEDYELRAYEGIYDVELTFLQPGLVPDQPQSPILIAQDLAITEDTQLNVDIALVRVEIEVNLEQEDLPADWAGTWNVTLNFEGAESHFFASVPADLSESVEVNLPVGQYAVSALIQNEVGTFQASLNLDGAWTLTGEQKRVFDLHLGALNTALTFADLDLELIGGWGITWRLELFDPQSNTRIEVETSGSGIQSLPAIPGNYQAQFAFGSRWTPSAPLSVPTNLKEIVGEFSISKGEENSLAANLVAYRLSGQALWAGSAIENTEDDAGEWLLEALDVHNGQQIQIAIDGGDANYEAWLYPGTFDFYTRLQDGSAVPNPVLSQHLYEREVDILEDRNFDFWFDPVELSGRFSWPGSDLNSDGGVSISLLRTDALGFEQSNAFTGDADYSLWAFPGTYQLSYSFYSEDTVQQQIQGKRTTQWDLQLFTTTIQDINESVLNIGGPVRFAGSAIPQGEDGSPVWQLIFEDSYTGEVYWSKLGGGSDYSAVIYPGTYDIYMSLTEAGLFEAQPEGWLPVHWALEIMADRDDLAVEPELIQLKGLSTLDGVALPEASADSDSWKLMTGFPGRQKQLIVPFQGGASTYSVLIPPYTYDLQMEFFPDTADELLLSHEPYDLIFCAQTHL